MLRAFQLVLLDTIDLVHGTRKAQGNRKRGTGWCYISISARVFAIIDPMEMPFTPDQNAFVREAMAAGRLHSPEDALREAMVLWESRERTRARILAAVDEAEASLERGEGRTLTEEDLPGFVEEIHQRGLARLASKQSTSI